MAVYTGAQSILNAALGKYAGKGFALYPCLTSPDIIALDYNGEPARTFSTASATVEQIQKACRKCLRDEKAQMA